MKDFAEIDNISLLIIYQFRVHEASKNPCAVFVQKSTEMDVDGDQSGKKAGVKSRVDFDGDSDSEEIESSSKNAQSPKLLSSIYNYLVVLSIILIVFAAFRNSVTW